MPIAVRLLLALGLLALFVTALVGYSARNVARREVERSHAQRLTAAVAGTEEELRWHGADLSRAAAPLCGPNDLLGDVLGQLERAGPGGGDESRETAAKLLAARAAQLRLDGVVLATADGSVLAATERSLMGQVYPRLAQRLRRGEGPPTVVPSATGPVLEQHCARRVAGELHGMVVTRELEPLLERLGRAYGVDLELTPSSPSAAAPAARTDEPLRRALALEDLAGARLTVSAAPIALQSGLSQMDRSILLAGGIAVLLSIALAVFMAGQLSKPIVQLAAQTREVVHGKPLPVKVRGGRELADLARSFNRSIDELAAMRRRVTAVERIAARREMARQIAHEIKNPLAPIRAAVETLRRLRQRQAPQFDEYFEEATATVLAEVHRISEIVTEFTKFARMRPPEFERVDLAEVARAVVGLHDGKGITGAPRIRLDAEQLPEVLADRDQLVQVLTNLVQNGIEAARSSTDPPVLPVVEVQIRRESKHLARLTITDNGPGVPPEMRERLFEPYASTKSEGTGLGLAIAQRIIYEHGGEIRCEDPSDGGAQFVVLLPFDGPPLSALPPESLTGTPPPAG
ncbi:MAG: HAMP domain-containing protein [Deltaproteobacteria bacterium]|nr:HAMP domain-containing protein [Deltaproteobacteria bacterium]MBW2537954.1 HAMP domain-containing protein [Deltaproteobacteria bacterium]